MCKPFGIHVSGPLEPFVSGFLEELARQGYSPWSATSYLVVMRHLSRWLGDQEWAVAELTPQRVQEFVAERRARGYAKGRSNGGMVKVLISYLRSIGAVPEVMSLAPKTHLAWVLDSFTTYLISQRGLAQGTIHWYRYVAHRFLSTCEISKGVAEYDFEGLTTDKVTAFILAESRHRSVGSLQNVAVALRAFLRFLYLQAHTPLSLAAAVLPAPSWRDTGLSRALPEQQVARILASCDRQTNAGCRDFAILILLTRLGLRSKEVASLMLDDVDWRNGEILVSGKGNRHDRLPLPVDVGEALADYCCQARPGGNCRTLFLHVRAPYTALSSSSIGEIVKRACERAGLPPTGAHRLRHSAATAMRRAGAPLLEIGQVLRHRRPATTAHYAKDDHDALASVARRWPRGCSMIDLRQQVSAYVTMRRSLGFKLRGHDRLLTDFVDYLDHTGASTVTSQLALAWATKPTNVQPLWWKKRLSVVCGFSRYLHTLDPSVEVPAPDLLAYRYQRPIPYLFSETEITGLIDAAGTLSPPLRAATHQALFGLLAVTGMRIGEAIRLDCDDLDLEAGLIRIRQTKFNKSRQLPLHPTTIAALKEYTRQRDWLGGKPRVPSFFVSTCGTRLIDTCVRLVFAQLIARIGLKPRSGSGRPHIHSLRHTFAVATLREWYRAGEDVTSKLPLLSAYLGHVDPVSTYWYLQAAPELLALAAERIGHPKGGFR